MIKARGERKKASMYFLLPSRQVCFSLNDVLLRWWKDENANNFYFTSLTDMKRMQKKNTYLDFFFLCNIDKKRNVVVFNEFYTNKHVLWLSLQ